MPSNEEWLRSLSVDQIREEIKYGALLAEMPRHKNHFRRELEQARAELRRRENDND